jgi:hypothetical protein
MKFANRAPRKIRKKGRQSGKRGTGISYSLEIFKFSSYGWEELRTIIPRNFYGVDSPHLAALSHSNI